MEKPKKLIGNGDSSDNPFGFGRVTGFNEALDLSDKYHEWDKAQNYISKDRLPSIKELENIIEKTAVEYNKNKITPDFIWKCSLTDLAKAIKVWWEGK